MCVHVSAVDAAIAANDVQESGYEVLIETIKNVHLSISLDVFGELTHRVLRLSQAVHVVESPRLLYRNTHSL